MRILSSNHWRRLILFIIRASFLTLPDLLIKELAEQAFILGDKMPRHRGVYKPSVEPYELSRFRVENFMRCPACFYMQQVEGIKFPEIPGFNINEATDVLLKRHFDRYVTTGSPPILIEKGFANLVPFNRL